MSDTGQMRKSEVFFGQQCVRYFGAWLKFYQYRHAATAFGRIIERGVCEDIIRQIIDHQADHSSEVPETHYAIDRDAMRQTTTSKLDDFLAGIKSMARNDHDPPHHQTNRK